MTTATVDIVEGASPTKHVATYSIAEDAATKQIQRIGINTSAGIEVVTAAGIITQGSQIATASATIASGQSLSPGVDLGSQSLVGVQTPSAIDGATALTFQVSYDNATFANLYDNQGNEYSVTCAASRSIILPIADFIGVRAVKVRLGTSGTPVSATANRTMLLATRP